MKKLLTFAVVLIITACAGSIASNKISAEKISNIKKVGFYSGFDNVFHIYLKGAHSYDDVHKEIKMPAWWNLNKQAHKTIKEKFKNSKVTKLNVEVANPTIPQIISEAKTKDIDTVIIITPLPLNVQPVMNYGMAKLSEQQKQAYLIFDISVFDVKSGNKLSSSTGLNKEKSVYFDLPLDFREYFNYHKDEVEKIFAAYNNVISARTENALKEMGF